ncbi:hypothetical protein [Streptomyces sp. NPDC088727]|uniref:hypothetical protein n=1 Tax=Streptomyces sp. NPDC088727 TaxID=3365875 RepID=UPI00381446C9
MISKLPRRSFLELRGLAGIGLAAAGCSSAPSSDSATWSMWSSEYPACHHGPRKAHLSGAAPS